MGQDLRCSRASDVATIDSDYGSPIFPNLAKDLVPDRPDQLWMADLTYVTVPGRFIYVAIIAIQPQADCAAG